MLIEAECSTLLRDAAVQVNPHMRPSANEANRPLHGKGVSGGNQQTTLFKKEAFYIIYSTSPSLPHQDIPTGFLNRRNKTRLSTLATRCRLSTELYQYKSGSRTMQ